MQAETENTYKQTEEKATAQASEQYDRTWWDRWLAQLDKLRPSIRTSEGANVVAAHIVFARGFCDDGSLKFDDERIKASRYKLLSDLAEIVEENRKRNLQFEQRPRMTPVSFSQYTDEGDTTASNMTHGNSDESAHEGQGREGSSTQRSSGWSE